MIQIQSILVFVTIFVPILYPPTFCESNASDFHFVMTENGSGKVLEISEDFRRLSEDLLPNVAENEMFSDVPKTFEHSQSYLKDENFSVL